MFLLLPAICFGAQEVLTFQWNQDIMEAGDKWEMHVSTTSGGGYIKLAEIPYIDQQIVYEKVLDITIPAGGYYFALRKVRTDGAMSDWSNEVFFSSVNSPFELKLIFK